MTATVTAYTPVECGGRTTAAGTQAKEYVTLAASDHIPLGTRVYIPSRGWGIVEDRTNPRYNKKHRATPRIDIFMEDPDTAKQWGIQKLDVQVGGYSSAKRKTPTGVRPTEPRGLLDIIDLYLGGLTGNADREE